MSAPAIDRARYLGHIVEVMPGGGGAFDVTKPIRLLALAGDGIGPEVVAAGLEVMTRLCQAEGLTLELEEDLLGGAAWDAHGTFCRDRTVAAARRADAVLVGAVGGPRWDSLEIAGGPADKDGLMRLRQELQVFAGLRPAWHFPMLEHAVPIKPELVAGADIMVLRELCGGLPFGEPRGIEELPDGSFTGTDANFYGSAEIARVARVGFELARRRGGRLTSVDKANVMESGALWRRVVGQIGVAEFPDVALSHLYADNALYQIVHDPRAFDVVLGDNLFGDLISDLAGTIAGSLGMLPSASLSGLEGGGPAIYEPVHGSAPDIAGQGIANPFGMILSVAMAFDYSLARPDLARRIEAAVERTLAAGVLPADLGGRAATSEVTKRVILEMSRGAGRAMKILFTDFGQPDLALEQDYLREAQLDWSEAAPQCETAEDVIGHGAGHHALVAQCAPITRAVFEALPDLRIVSVPQIGIDTIDLEAAREHGVWVANVPAGNVTEVAAHALAMTLAMIRQLAAFDRDVRAGVWHYESAGPLRRPGNMTFGLLGFGKIGQLVAARAAPFFGRILAYDPYLPEAAWPAGVERAETIPGLLAESHVVTLHMPLTEESQGLISSEALGQMMPGSYLVNVARGPIVDTNAVIAALDSGQLAGAALDVLPQEPPDPADPILKHPKVLLSPHSAFYSVESDAELRRSALDNIVALIEQGRPHHVVVEGR